MNEEMVLSLGAEAMRTTIYLAGPMLAVAMVVGIGVSVLQAVTQINESTLTFIPKIVAIAAVLAIGAPWMVEVLSQYTTDLITRFPELIQ